MKNRYTTPFKYTDGNGKERHTTATFELDPIEFMDWTFEHPFEANELQASMSELNEVAQGVSRDLTQDEIRTMLYVIKILTQLSYGTPDDAGDYFIRDPRWADSYKYRGFRMFLMTHPKEVEQFLNALLDNDVMEKFTKALQEANDRTQAEKVVVGDGSTPDSGPDTVAKMQQRIKELEAANNQGDSTPPAGN